MRRAVLSTDTVRDDSSLARRALESGCEVSAPPHRAALSNIGLTNFPPLLRRVGHCGLYSLAGQTPSSVAPRVKRCSAASRKRRGRAHAALATIAAFIGRLLKPGRGSDDRDSCAGLSSA